MRPFRASAGGCIGCGRLSYLCRKWRPSSFRSGKPRRKKIWSSTAKSTTPSSVSRKRLGAPHLSALWLSCSCLCRPLSDLLSSHPIDVASTVRETRSLNVAVAALMELSNHFRGLQQQNVAPTVETLDGVRTLLVMLSPIAPHLAAHLWAALQHLPSARFAMQVWRSRNAWRRLAQAGLLPFSSRLTLRPSPARTRWTSRPGPSHDCAQQKSRR